MTLTHADLSGEGSDGTGGDSSQRSTSSGPRAAHAQRRVFSNAYKLRIVQEYDGLSEHGARGALLRREGLYQSHIEKWRKARDAGRLTRSGRPGGDGSPGNPRGAGDGEAGRSEKRRLQQENDRLTAELAKTRAVAEILGKAHALLEMISEGAEKPTSSTR
jgi:transposase-like protein